MSKNNKPYFIGLNRAMISLGPLSPTRYCTYSCAFCYVQSDKWGKYPTAEIDEILDFLREEKKKNSYKVIYISGDTDSFAPPRTMKALELLRALLEFNVDVTITTRYVFNKNELNELVKINGLFRGKGLVLSVSISIPRLLSGDHLESPNTPSPRERILFLKRLKESGINTMLALRPFLPIIPLKEYEKLIFECREFVDAVLGEVWYVDKKGSIEKRVLIDKKEKNIEFKEHSMDFNIKDSSWKVWENNALIEAINDHCKELGLPFFMRSQPALDLIRDKVFKDQT